MHTSSKLGTDEHRSFKSYTEGKLYFPHVFFMYSLITEIFGVDNKNVCQFRSYVTSVPFLENVCRK